MHGCSEPGLPVLVRAACFHTWLLGRFSCWGHPGPQASARPLPCTPCPVAVHHRLLMPPRPQDASCLPDNSAMEGIPDAIAAAAAAVEAAEASCSSSSNGGGSSGSSAGSSRGGSSRGVVVMVVQPGERNAYDQQVRPAWPGVVLDCCRLCGA